MVNRTRRMVGWAGLAAWLSLRAAAASPAEEAIRILQSVGPEGRGNEPAAAAFRILAKEGPEVIPLVLEGMDSANDYGLNWLRSAAETMAARAAAGGAALPIDALIAILRDKTHQPRARRFAYELIFRQDAGRAAVLLPNFVNDPSDELRRDAVDQIAERAGAKALTDKAGGVVEYRRALEYAREPNQIESLVGKLTALGETVDLPRVFGWVTQWKLVGPFDNVGGAGFETAFPPEASVNLKAEYAGKAAKLHWQDYETRHDYGWVNFNQPMSALKGVAGYAYTEFWSDKIQTVQIRLGSENAWKVWANGKFLFGHDEYHRAHEIDQYRLPTLFKAGRNTILVKCLQNEQTEDWAADWQFQLRVTDADGTPLKSTR